MHIFGKRIGVGTGIASAACMVGLSVYGLGIHLRHNDLYHSFARADGHVRAARVANHPFNPFSRESTELEEYRAGDGRVESRTISFYDGSKYVCMDDQNGDNKVKEIIVIRWDDPVAYSYLDRKKDHGDYDFESADRDFRRAREKLEPRLPKF